VTLRDALFIAISLLWAGTLYLMSHDITAWPAFAGLTILLIAILFERRYHPAATKPDGTEWIATDEQFVDDVSGKLVKVWYNPRTGERRYIDN
jgi:hypothetical protein